MDVHARRILEFDTVLALMAARAETPMGRERVLALEPLPTIEAMLARQTEVREMGGVCGREGSMPLGGVHDVRAALAQAHIGSVLTPQALLEIASTAAAARTLRRFLEDRSETCPILAGLALGLIPAPALEKAIRGAIGEDGQVLDSASAALRDFRVRIRATERRIQDALIQFQGGQHAKMLQERLITIRDHRYCLPVKAECRGQFPGLVVDQSASGQTLFMEPWAVVDLGNTLRHLTLAETREIEIILAKLTTEVRAVGTHLETTLATLGHVDLIQAAARDGAARQGMLPGLNTRGALRLVQARHPLIAGDVVPIDLELGYEFTTLVITGPNTGGKTVTLKTVGLFTLLAMCGLMVPAAPGTELARFPKIFADIGDEQSIAQSLSTFSSHMTNIVRILPQAGPDALVLLDEVGAGTDPTEGTALAISILERLHQSGCRTVATTHYTALKTFAAISPGISNAAVEFDVESLRPTYTVTLGLPGRSCALDISERLGLPAPLLHRAREVLSGEHHTAEQLIAELSEDRTETAKARDAARRDQARLARAVAQVEDELAGLEDKRRRELDKVRMKGESLLHRARAETGALVEQTRVRLAAAEAALSAERAAMAVERMVLATSKGGEDAQADAIPPASRGRKTWRSPALNETLRAVEDGLDHLAGEWAEALPAGEDRPRPPEGMGAAARRRLAAAAAGLGPPLPEAELEEGRQVFVASLGQSAVVVRRPEGGHVLVQVGVVKLEVPVDQVRAADPPGGTPQWVDSTLAALPAPAGDPEWRSREAGSAPEGQGERHAAVERRLNIRGERVEEGLYRLEKYLDDAALAQHPTVEILHGKGTGALRQAVHQYLQNHPLVAGFRDAEPSAGGTGVTVVTLQ